MLKPLLLATIILTIASSAHAQYSTYNRGYDDGYDDASQSNNSHQMFEIQEMQNRMDQERFERQMQDQRREIEEIDRRGELERQMEELRYRSTWDK